MRFSRFFTISLASAAVITVSQSSKSSEEQLSLFGSAPPTEDSASTWSYLVRRAEEAVEAPPPTKSPSPPKSTPAPPKPNPPPKSIPTSPKPNSPPNNPPKGNTPSKGPASPPKKCKRTDPACSTPAGPAGPAQAPPKPPSPEFKTSALFAGQTFLDIDQPSVGVLLSNGKYEWFRDGTGRRSGQLQANQGIYKKIGTDTLATCTSIFLIGRNGALGMHLRPGVCELFLKTAKKGLKPEAREQLKSQHNLDDATYKDWEKEMKNIKDEARRLFNWYQKDLGNYQLYIVRGMYQNSDVWGSLMAKDILGLDSGTAISSPQRSTYLLILMRTFGKLV
jgi:hypothetical protein